LLPVLLVGVTLALRAARRARNATSSATQRQKTRDPDDSTSVDALPYSTQATEKAAMDCLQLAFEVAHCDAGIVGEHAAVLDSVANSIDESVHQREYFPRRPMQLPKLMQALNDSEATRKDLVRLILEDPTLAGSVLQRANSAFYRVSPEPVENMDRAVVMLGIDGLRGLLAAAILQPVFRVPRGSFEKFATVTWEQAERASIAAEKHAKLMPGTDPFVAQLLGLLSLLANIVLFRLTMDKYREHPDLLPRAEVFICAIQSHRQRMARLIASTWELTDMSLRALHEQEQRVSPREMGALGRCVYFGELCAVLSTLAARGLWSQQDALSTLQGQGLDERTCLDMWGAAVAVGRD
jgi:HD-like signal output (HDOD) protein